MRPPTRYDQFMTLTGLVADLRPEFAPFGITVSWENLVCFERLERPVLLSA
jgi:hypothetical protein